MEPLVIQARQLSADTISTLSGFKYYTDIDALRQEFVEFCQNLKNPPEKWQEAWIIFTKENFQ